MILIGHGLGGLIVKRVSRGPELCFNLLTCLQALGILSNPDWRLNGKILLNMIAGVVLFGTPHTKTKQPEQWCRLTPLLSLVGKLPKRFIAQSETDANAVAIICEEFEQSGLEATVLSIYETKPTKFKSTRWRLKDSVTVSLGWKPGNIILLTTCLS